MDYNAVTKEYDVYRRRSVTDWVLGLDIVANIFEPLSQKKIFDYGCGPGRFSRFLGDKGAMVHGADTSREMIQMAESFDHPNVKYSLIEPGCVPENLSNQFDGVVLNFVLCTLPNPETIAHILKKLYTVMKPGGIITALNANWEVCNGHDYISFIFDTIPHLYSGLKVGTILKSDTPVRVEDYFWSKKEYEKFFLDAGFKNIHLQETIATDNSYPWIDEKTFSPLCIIRGEK